ncbi:hypothetical protein C2E23DRAFT_42668 [Lenzites betulinus]|nr:hypothetical protein C2E23DRAFT_42668 [Lenzites betulinus]
MLPTSDASGRASFGSRPCIPIIPAEKWRCGTGAFVRPPTRAGRPQGFPDNGSSCDTPAARASPREGHGNPGDLPLTERRQIRGSTEHPRTPQRFSRSLAGARIPFCTSRSTTYAREALTPHWHRRRPPTSHAPQRAPSTAHARVPRIVWHGVRAPARSVARGHGVARRRGGAHLFHAAGCKLLPCARNRQRQEFEEESGEDAMTAASCARVGVLLSRRL